MAIRKVPVSTFTVLLLCLLSVSFGVEDSTFSCIFQSKTCEDFKACCEKLCSQKVLESFCLNDRNGTLATLPETKCECKSADDDGNQSMDVYEIKVAAEKCRQISENRCDSFNVCCHESCPDDEFHAFRCFNDENSKNLDQNNTECYCVKNFKTPLTFNMNGPLNRPFDDKTEKCMSKQPSIGSCNEFETCCRDACQSENYAANQQMCIRDSQNRPLRSLLTYCKCISIVAHQEEISSYSSTPYNSSPRTFKNCLLHVTILFVKALFSILL